MRKVLIVTYHWPPAGGPGVQRVLKFAKYLPQFGWQPLILTVKEGEYPALDESLIKDIPENCKVYKTASLEPNLLYKKLTGMKETDRIPVAILSEKKTDWKSKFAAWIRLNVFIPDAKRGWVPFAVKQGLKIIKDEKPEIILSSSPPPSVHLVAKKLSGKTGLKWIADFRDPWTDIHYYENMPRLKISKKIDRRLESTVLKQADKILSVSKLDIEHDFSKKVPAKKCIHIPNGYDDEDFSDLPTPSNSFPGFLLMHLGAIGKERLPDNLFRAIYTLHKTGEINPANFRLELIGRVEESVLKSIESFMISEYVKITRYMPHKEAIAQSKTASAMLLLVTQSEKNKRILPGKTFEYINTQKPILALGPEDGEVARILRETKSGVMIEFKNENKILNNLRKLLQQSEVNKSRSTNKPFLKQYSRRNLTERLSKVFADVLNTT